MVHSVIVLYECGHDVWQLCKAVSVFQNVDQVKKNHNEFKKILQKHIILLLLYTKINYAEWEYKYQKLVKLKIN